MVIGYHGRNITLQELRPFAESGRDGFNAQTLIKVAQKFQLQGQGYALDLDGLDALPPASILHWNFNHFVVLDRLCRNAVIIVDPSFGRRSVALDEFSAKFTGVAITFQTVPGFCMDHDSHEPQIWKPLIARLCSQKGIFIRVILLGLLTQALLALVPLFLGILIDRVIPNHDYSLWLVVTIAFVFTQLVSSVADFARSIYILQLGRVIEERLTKELLQHLTQLPFSFFQRHTSGDLAMRVGSGSALRGVVASIATTVLSDSITASVYLLVLFVTDKRAAGIGFLLALLRLAVFSILRVRQRGLIERGFIVQAESYTHQTELFEGMEALKSMGLEHVASLKWVDSFCENLGLTLELGTLEAFGALALSWLASGTTLLFLFIGSRSVINGQITTGTMLTCSALVAGLLAPLGNLIATASQVQRTRSHAERIADVFSTPKEQEEAVATTEFELAGKIELRNLSFRYPGAMQNSLENVSFKLRAGSKVAIVGKSGSGKSTLARVIAGLYPPDSGDIFYDDLSISKISLAALRRQLGIVTQDTHLFSGTIRSNIALHDSSMAFASVLRAAQIAEIDEDIRAMPMGYSTTLSGRGQTLSGGQRQRLAIARAVASGARALIFDEATSHLDHISEERIAEQLESMSQTQIIVAHRLNTIRNAHQIILLEAGRVEATGTHQELMATSQLYRELFGDSYRDSHPINAVPCV